MLRLGVGLTGLEVAGQPAPIVRALRRTTGTRTFRRLVVLALFVCAWEYWAATNDGLLMPGFFEAVQGARDLVSDGTAATALRESNKSLVLGYGLAVVVGVPLGLLIGQSRASDQATRPYLSILLVTPMAALIPSFIIAFGFGLMSRTLLVAFFAVVMVVVNSQAGVRQVDRSLVEMARSYGASTYQLWRRVMLPGALPAIMAGLRIGLGRAVSGVVIVELLMSPAGIGGVMLDARDTFNASALYGMVILVLIESVVLIELLRAIERRLVGWQS